MGEVAREQCTQHDKRMRITTLGDFTLVVVRENVRFRLDSEKKQQVTDSGRATLCGSASLASKESPNPNCPCSFDPQANSALSPVRKKEVNRF
jgi:hypothetical protein